MPPCGFEDESIHPLLLFLRASYREIKKLAKARDITTEEAMEEELDRLEKCLSRLHLNDRGELVERSQAKAG